MTTLLIVLVVAVVVATPLVVSYNRFVHHRHQVQESWRQVEAELHHRHELVPTLVETVRKHAPHNRNVYEQVERACAVAAGAGSTPREQAGHEAALAGSLGRLLTVAADQHDLAASDDFRELRDELTEVEDRIATHGRTYNTHVAELNQRITAFPSRVLANIYGFVAAEPFAADEHDLRSVAVPQS